MLIISFHNALCHTYTDFSIAAGDGRGINMFLAMLGLGTISALLVAILSQRVSPLVAVVPFPVPCTLAAGFGLRTGGFIVAEKRGACRIVGQTTTGFTVSPLAPTPFLPVGLCGTSLAEHQRYSIPFLFAATLLMVAASLIFGIFPL